MILLNDIIKFYGIYIGLIKEWNHIDKQFILRDLIPYVTKGMPYTPSGKVPFNNTDDILKLLQTDDVLKNQIKMDKVYKESNQIVYAGVLTKMKELLNDINTEIERLK